jgi:hypothetical protein
MDAGRKPRRDGTGIKEREISLPGRLGFLERACLFFGGAPQRIEAPRDRVIVTVSAFVEQSGRGPVIGVGETPTSCAGFLLSKPS